MHKARKDHTCGECGKKIPKGHRYWRNTTTDEDGSFISAQKEHTNCLYYEGEMMGQPKDRPWEDYPVGTKAHSCIGGHWTKVKGGGWKWFNGCTFPTPGGDAVSVTLPGED